MNVKGERKGSGAKTGIPDDQIEGGSRTSNEHVEDPGRTSGGHERRTDVLLGKIRRYGVGGMTITGVDSGNIMETGHRSGVRNDGNSRNRGIISVNIGRGDLQFNFLKKNRRVLTNRFEKSGPSAKVVMKDSGNILIITKSKGADMTGLGNKTGQSKNRRGGSGYGRSNRLRTLRRGANWDGHG